MKTLRFTAIGHHQDPELIVSFHSLVVSNNNMFLGIQSTADQKHACQVN